MPRPRGRSPIAACVAASTPLVRKRSSARRSLVEHADRGVPRAGELARRLEQPLEHDLEVELGDQRAAGLEQPRRGVVVALGCHRRH